MSASKSPYEGINNAIANKNPIIQTKKNHEKHNVPVNTKAFR